MEEKIIVFSGHFDIGERPTDLQNRTVDDAFSYDDAQLAILVGDIGVHVKIADYIRGGIEAVKENYRFRKVDCTSTCILSQLPDENELDDAIDEEQYKKAVEILKDYIDLEGDDLEKRLADPVRDFVIPELIKDRLKIYHLDEDSIKIYSERKMRNIVTWRTRSRTKKKKQSWRNLDLYREDGKSVFIGPQEIVNVRGIPICRGIMTALYETVAKEGYDKVVQIYSTKHAASLTKAQEVYESIADKLPQTKGKDLQFEYKWHD